MKIDFQPDPFDFEEEVKKVREDVEQIVMDDIDTNAGTDADTDADTDVDTDSDSNLDPTTMEVLNGFSELIFLVSRVLNSQFI
ncbi:GL14439 [Drosophila persimilis]|uniref:GL14439 n=1 Tax=Drosophila persimilis TaxID=7234 RepID=B4GTX0_DROPE|nr:GL14439 [Drosophila persimilis]